MCALYRWLQTAEEINTMLRQYEQLSALRLWLVKRVERGLSIPDTMEETTELVRLDPTGFPAKKFRFVCSGVLSSVGTSGSDLMGAYMYAESSADTRGLRAARR